MVLNGADEPMALTVADAARLLGRTELATRRAIERGTIPARRAGRRIFVLRSDLERYLETLPKRGGAA
jgi:excisionase family DNA binding protein